MVGCDKANYGSLKGMQIFITDGNDDVAVRSTSRDASAITPIRIDVSPEYGMTYYGLLVDVVFYEFQMADFSLRWYGQDYGSYKARDAYLCHRGQQKRNQKFLLPGRLWMGKPIPRIATSPLCMMGCETVQPDAPISSNPISIPCFWREAEIVRKTLFFWIFFQGIRMKRNIISCKSTWA
ncbi:hypothetical protein DSECCO2_609340 [anaerobic digester metagenome]